MMLSAMFLCKLIDTIKHDGAYKLWQNLKLAFQAKSGLWDAADWGKKWVVNFNSGITQIVSFDR